MSEQEQKTQLRADEAEWQWLRPHLERGAVIVADPDLEFLSAARLIAQDDAAAVGRLIANGKLRKPSGEDIAVWDLEPQKLFAIVIVSPFILIQEIGEERVKEDNNGFRC